MKRLMILVVAALLAAPSFVWAATSGTDEVIRLAKDGVSEDVLLTYINSQRGGFELAGKTLDMLNDLGVSSKVLSALILHWRMRSPVQPVSSTTRQMYVASEAFTADLAPYGTWLPDPGYGMVWKPTAEIRDSSWRPYCTRGRWIYSDQGWYWDSYYSWGWAPFHYGRWVNDPLKHWVWLPGTDWAPAWTIWREGHNTIGWAPMPPGANYYRGIGLTYNGRQTDGSLDFGLKPSDYVFVGGADFLNPRIGPAMMPEDRSEELYKHTSNVADAYGMVDNHIVDRGVDMDLVARWTNRPIEVRSLSQIATLFTTAPLAESGTVPLLPLQTSHKAAQEQPLLASRPGAETSPRPQALTAGAR